jgi:GNAT superfamily N-acetyltransferase
MLDHEALHIRAPQLGDSIGLARSWLDAAIYYSQLAPDLFQVPLEDGLAAWLEDGVLNVPLEELILVAEYAGQAVGFIHVLIQPPLATAARQFVRDVAYPRLSIQALVVQQAYWRHGIGSKLLSNAEDWGRSRGARIALLDTYSESPISLPFYEQRMGYQRRTIHLRKSLG